MIIEDMLNADDTDQDRILNKIVEFENKSNIFQQKISITSYAKQKLWKELKSEQPNLEKL